MVKIIKMNGLGLNNFDAIKNLKKISQSFANTI